MTYSTPQLKHYKKNSPKLTVAIFPFCFIWFLNPFTLYAQAGTLDSNFGTDGRVYLKGEYLSADAIAIQNDGKIIEVGRGSLNGVNGFFVARFNVDGSVDESFGEKGRIVTYLSPIFAQPTSVALQQDGKIVVAGNASVEPYGSVVNIAITRYKINGKLDSSFGNNGIVMSDLSNGNSWLAAMAIQPDDKIVVTGTTQINKNDNRTSFTLRYNKNGKRDSTFGNKGKILTDFPEPIQIAAIAVQTDKKILIAGDYPYSSPGAKFLVVRYLQNGNIDSTFADKGIALALIGEGDTYAQLYSIAIQENNKIITAGMSASEYHNDKATLVRFKATGIIDSSFGKKGIVITAFGSHNTDAKKVLIQPDKKIIVAAHYYSNYTSSNQFALARYQTNGTIDSGFAVNGTQMTEMGPNARCADALLEPDGKIVLGGDNYFAHRKNDAHRSRFLLARYNGDNASAQIGNSYSYADSRITTKSEIRLYPNPARDIINLQGLNTSTINSISLIDINGNLLQKISTTTPTYQLNISLLSKGTYFIQVQNKTKTRTEKFLKE